MPRPPQIPQRRQPTARPTQNRQVQSALAELFQQGLALQRQGRLAQARAIYESVLKANPGHFDSLHLLGVIHAQTGNHQAAADMIARAIAINPNEAGAYFNRGCALMELKQLEAAVASYDQAIRIEANYVDAHFNRGNALKRLKQLDAAVASYDKAIHFKPDHFQAYYERGLALSDLGQAQAAVASYDNAIRIKPDHADAYNNRGVALKQLQQFEEAVQSYDMAIRVRPEYADAHSNRGNALSELKQLEAAVTSYDEAIRIHPGHAGAHFNRGLALQVDGQLEAAIASYDKAIGINPVDAQVHFNRGVALQASRQLEAAVSSYDKAVGIRADYAEAYFNKSMALLLGGDFANGWPMYEWRWKVGSKNLRKQQFAVEWKGTRLTGALLVLAEQGVGDEIFYAGMLNDLRPFAASLTVAVDLRLVALYQRSFNGIAVVAKDRLSAGQAFDAQIYMASLGQFLRRDIASFCRVTQGYLLASTQRVTTLRDGLAGGKRLVCGVSWSSKNLEVGARKSLSLNDLAPMLALGDIQFVNLQYGDTKMEREAFRDETGLTLECVNDVDNSNDLDGLAALIGACDVVVTVSNTTAHLAAALGKPVLIMLPYFSGVFWYWHQDRADSPWYPSARLIRQERVGDWAGVVQRVKADLSAMAGH